MLSIFSEPLPVTGSGPLPATGPESLRASAPERLPSTNGAAKAPVLSPAHEFLRGTLEVASVTVHEEAPNLQEGSAPEESVKETEEYEIVLGRRQIASVLFVATVMVAVFSGIAYLAGKSMEAKKAATVTATAAPVEKAAQEAPMPTIDATIVAQTAAASAATAAAKPVPAPEASNEPPIFADPKIGATYIQMAAVERGIAAVFAEGLRRDGFQSFVAPGPSDKMYRVLIGPMKDNTEYTRAKEELDRIGLTTFARKYLQEKPAEATKAP